MPVVLDESGPRWVRPDHLCSTGNTLHHRGNADLSPGDFLPVHLHALTIHHPSIVNRLIYPSLCLLVDVYLYAYTYIYECICRNLNLWGRAGYLTNEVDGRLHVTNLIGLSIEQTKQAIG